MLQPGDFSAFFCIYATIFYFLTETWYQLIKRQLAIARLRLHASMMSMCFSVCLFVCLSVAKMQKSRFSQKLSNLELWCLLTTY